MESTKEKGGRSANAEGEERRLLSSAHPYFSFLPSYTLFLSVLVIFVHSTHFSLASLQAVPHSGFFSTSFLIKIEFFFSEFLGQVAVPGFFFLSGFLFFRGLDDVKSWGRKLKSRVFSYVLPYLLWSSVMTLLYLSFGKAEWSLKNLWEGIFLYRFNPVFWYFYQLILLSFCLPFMAILVILIRGNTAINRAGTESAMSPLFLCFPLLFLLLVYFQVDVPFLNEDAAFYYFLGGSLALLWDGRKLFLPSFPLLVFALFCYAQTLLPHAIGILLLATVFYRLGMALFFLSLFMKKEGGILPMKRGKSILQTLSDMSFYIYASHYLFLRLWFFLQGFLETRTAAFTGDAGRDAFKLFFYLLSPVYCLFLAYFTGKGMKGLSPGLWKLLNGGRG
ncbi:hypothetical protein HMPREF9624_01518 [Oribacterium asaccharolyticum ACB7]|uniref:Acyltransferase 3 domain-containing protein n=1 Tax=Oribacterium asaccharolyticum ACB7 TaxID=796944 RepID=G9WWS4_9FIRM|nr:acyltransferase family protein [Oribacterium asaccharolyticum]EHL09477.1 hypothetical protein HMPREF9624_01518 [Oribacterium asaccharolyticum ACB7]